MFELIRNDKSKGGTSGTFEIEGATYFSMEQPDLGNTPYKSCVPQGDYNLIPWTSPKYGEVYIMVNEDLNVYKFENSPGRPDNGRFLCLFVHKGNYPRNFQGCVGAGRAYLEEQDMITATASTCKEVIKKVIEEGSYKLRISHEFE
ncbi:MAG: hypothetical protein E4H01_13745 [Lysobacterales bacterium]|nr:MAG: hypothetical protein E4H01_13745 [Xanthomonadales bacterium]